MRRSYPRNHHSRLEPNLLGATLKQRRIAANLSQQQLADSAFISRPFLTRLERGEYLQPSPDVLINLAKALKNVAAYDLFAAAGYALPELPEFVTYIRMKHPELPQAAIDELHRYYETIRDKYSANDAASNLQNEIN